MSAVSALVNHAELNGLRSIALVVADSLRWDSFVQARTPVLDRYAPAQQQRFSYASWTQPSHTCLLAGLLPHQSVPGVLAADTYAADRALWSAALGGSDLAGEMAADFSIASVARRRGWRTIGRVAMPVLHPGTPFSRGFDDYALSPAGSLLGSQAEDVAGQLSLDRDFVFINAGETHYPYLVRGLPRLSGAHGILKGGGDSAEEGIPFSASDLAHLHGSQVSALETLDRQIGHLLDVLPKPALLLFVSDHGELFGEEGFFGHGPFFHRTLFEVPLAAGIVR